ncbi:MAG: hypothetical protein HOY79_17655 [Streptomyces sp.]|nr:hypothetical protein [Streptomyces sp.]
MTETPDPLNAAYRERAHLVALLATWYPSHIGHTDPNAPDWAVLTVELPTGQACWHIAPDDMDLFAHVMPTPRYARGWDGHSAEEKYQRIDALAAQIAGESEIVMSMRAVQPQDDGDVRAVAALLKLGDVSFLGTWLTDYDDARSELESRFADRIAALEARDMKEPTR